MRGGLASAWFASLGLTSWRTVSKRHRPPLPSEVLATIVVFGGLSLLSTSDAAAPLAAVFGWGVVVAQLLGFFPATPGSNAQLPGQKGRPTVGGPVPTQGATPV